jgi:hypothetical protein
MTSRPAHVAAAATSFEQDDADGIAVDHFNHVIVRLECAPRIAAT